MIGDPFTVAPQGGDSDLDNYADSSNAINDADKIVTRENADDTWYKKTFSKVWEYIKSKINTNEIAPTKITNTTNFNFTSNDTTDANATSWTSVTKVDSVTDISIATFFQRITQMFKNVRYLYKMLGTTDISSIGNGTVTDILDKLSSSLSTVGTTNNGTMYSSVSIAGSGASGNLGELTLDKGTWLIIGGGWCPSSAGIFLISGTNCGQGWGQVNSGVEFMQTVSGIRNITTNNTKVYLQYTNWASNAVVNPNGLALYAVRIK